MSGNSNNSFEDFNFPIAEKFLIDPLLPENSMVCGYITDNKSNEPLENVNVTLYWHDGLGNYKLNYTKSNDLGFYHLNVASGEIALIFSLKSYQNEIIYPINIDENETLWINISMDKIIENSKVCGYILDNITNEPIECLILSLAASSKVLFSGSDTTSLTITSFIKTVMNITFPFLF